MDDSTVLEAAGSKGEESLLDSDKCYICLSSFDSQTVGSLESCQHVFCLECILQWSQTANTCPVDRLSFAFIHQRRCPGGAIQKKIKVRIQKNDEDEEEEGSSAVVCERCGRSDRRHRLLVCTLCDSGYHMDCLIPPLPAGPEGDWICPECAVIPQLTDGSMEEEISDGELTDLLAEADETPTTSSRLRPSTINRPSSSREQRRSQRIQSRASHVPKYLLRASKPADQTQEVSQNADSNAAANMKKRKRKK